MADNVYWSELSSKTMNSNPLCFNFHMLGKVYGNRKKFTFIFLHLGRPRSPTHSSPSHMGAEAEDRRMSSTIAKH
jgi:hypothetical protein